MEPDRADLITDLYHAALERAPEDRDAFLREACDGDEALRQEVGSLLGYSDAAAPFLETPAAGQVARALAGAGDGTQMVGHEVGPYKILAPLGVGGMGEVYRARDSKLGRDVAIKILPSHFTADPERRARFAREARLLATLNHPHIGAIYGLEESDGLSALVLELVEGPTLADRLERGPLPIAEALAVARQIAEALDEAHEKGIVHRDLKPANIVLQGATSASGVLSGDARVKVLDFGLAKSISPGLDGDLTQRPDGSLDGTADGRILGTPAYMSPEQARGLPVDKRTDIWAFGCVLFEMLTGRRPFEGDTVTDTFARILEHEPEWSALPDDTPAPIRSLIERCLRKDARKRLHDIADTAFEFQDVPVKAETAAPLPARRALRWTTVVPWTLAIVLGGTLAWLTTLHISSGPLVRRSAIRMELDLPPGVDLWSPFTNGASVAFAPDGSRIAFIGTSAGDRYVYVRRLDQFETQPVRGTFGANTVCFSPDGRSIVVILINQLLQKVSLDDGLAVTLARDADTNAGAVWSADGRIVFGRANVLWEVPATGGPAVQLTTLSSGTSELAHRWPAAAANPNTILFTVVMKGAAQETRIEAFSKTTRQRHTVVDSGAFPLYVPSGHLIFSRDHALLAAQFDSGRVRLTGPPVRILEDVRMTATGAPTLAVSPSDAVAYTAGGRASRLVWVSRQNIEEALPIEAGRYANPRLALDGRVLVSKSGDLWVQDPERGMARLTSDPSADNSFPVWTPDGKRAIFRTLTGLRVMDVDGSGRSASIAHTSEADYPTSVSPDGHTLLFMRMTAANYGDLYLLSLNADSAPRPVVDTPAYEGGGQFSPDGHLLAFTSNEFGHFQVFVRSVGGSNRKSLVSQSGKYPRWNPNLNKRELFYRDGDRLMAVDVAMRDEVPSFSTPRLLVDRRYESGPGQTMPNYDVTADGQRFVMVRNESGDPKFSVVLNWFDELTRLALPKPPGQ